MEYLAGALLALAVGGWLSFRYRPTPLWALYLSFRWWILTALRRNPICQSGPSFWRYLQMVRARKKSQRVALLETDGEGRAKWRCDLGDFWIPKGTQGDFVGFVAGEQSANTYHYFRPNERNGAVVLDCGANIGTFTRLALNSGAWLVVAIEPAPENLLCLRRNFDEEIRQGKVILYEGGLWDRDDRLFLATSTQNPGAGHIVESADSAGPGVWVPLTTVDRIVSELGLARLDFMKMDIEGAEQKALAGASETIRKWRPRIAVGTEHTTDFFANSEDVLGIVRGIDPQYRHQCGFCGVVNSKRRNGWVLTPVSLIFEWEPGPRRDRADAMIVRRTEG